MQMNIDFSNPDRACDQLDALGFIPRVQENQADFLARAKRDFAAPLPEEVKEEFRKDIPIGTEILQEGAARTEELFGFSAINVPGYFLNRGMGLFWAGCSFSDEAGHRVIALRKGFARNRHWFLYDRSELLAHEQVHAMRTPLNEEGGYEEHFAYMTSKSAFRRFTGNCFRNRTDSMIFLGGLGLLLLAELAVGFRIMPELNLNYFLVIALIYPVCLLFQNIMTRRIYFRARKHLLDAGFRKPDALLCRATEEEISWLAKVKGDHLTALLEKLKNTELRWVIALRRFGAEH